MLTLGKYSLGVGDRFAHQARAQLQACLKATAEGVEVIPVWNKSNREHVTIGSEPANVRAAADAAVRELNWNRPYHVDADHIRRDTVERFVAHSDFFTIDVADFIGRPAEASAVKAFVDRHGELAGKTEIAGIGRPLEMGRAAIESVANQ
ncbi:MAG TPA: tagaturonate epimerase family protein, partial [Haliangiales bacterium]|nr:tagaturonate epimerase family protein [Haliangiales bacterium]